MKTMTLYREKDSLIHRIDPLTKMLFVFVAVSTSYIVPDHVFVLSVLTATFVILIAGKVFKYILPVIALSFLLIASIIFFQGFFHPDRATVLFIIGSIPIYKEGFSIAFLVTLRVVTMISAFGVLILTTKPDDLVETLVEKGLSPRFAYVLLSVLQIIPQMITLTGRITDAQRARGLETEGGLWMRFKSFIPLLGPVVLNSLNETRERSIALEIRGFNSKGPRTYLHEHQAYPYRWPLKIALVVFLVATIVWRLVA